MFRVCVADLVVLFSKLVDIVDVVSVLLLLVLLSVCFDVSLKTSVLNATLESVLVPAFVVSLLLVPELLPVPVHVSLPVSAVVSVPVSVAVPVPVSSHSSCRL